MTTFRRALLVLTFATMVVIGPATAAEDAPKPAPKQKSLTVGQTIRLQMAKKQIIKSVVVDREGIVHVMPAFNDMRTLVITGLAPGKARIVVTGEDGEKMALTVGQ